MEQRRVKAYLTVRVGPEAGRRYVLRLGQRFVLGRGRDVSVHIDDHVVSRRHAALELLPDGLHVSDLGSRNGTFLDGRPIRAGRSRLSLPEDLLQIGDNLFDVKLIDIDAETFGELARTRRWYKPLLSREEFEILGEIGRGATGIVYAARQKLLSRNVAIKVPRQDFEEDEQARARFLREGQLACRVDSPYVVTIHDFRTVGKQVYLVMELVNGISAKDRVFSGPLPLDEALQIGEHVACALEAAHRVGVVHRDIKPSNILLSPDGLAKLSDFGIAKELGTESDGMGLTPSGEGLGTLAFVSPEQATDARQVDPRSDIYSLGATLYNLISGKPLWVPRTADDLLKAFDNPFPRLDTAQPNCPEPVADLIHHMLEKQVDHRPAGAAGVAVCLRRILDDLREAQRSQSDLIDTQSRKLSETELEETQVDEAIDPRAGT